MLRHKEGPNCNCDTVDSENDKAIHNHSQVYDILWVRLTIENGEFP